MQAPCAQLAVVRKTIEQGAEQLGAAVDFADERSAARIWWIKTSLSRRFEAACKTLGVGSRVVSTYGGSDNNTTSSITVRGVVVSLRHEQLLFLGEYSLGGRFTAAAKPVETPDPVP